MPVTAQGVFHTSAGALSRNAPVSLEMFDVKRGAWVGVGKGKTDLRGRCSVTADVGDEGFLPALRLRHALSGQILDSIRSTTGTAGDLTIDFGADERSALERTLGQRQAQLADALTAQKGLDDRLKARVNEIGVISAEHDSLAKRLQGVESQLKDRSRELLQSATAFEQLKSERDDLNGQLAESVAAHDGLKVQLRAAESERDDVAIELTSTTRAFEDLKGELGQTVAARDRLTTELNTAETKLAASVSERNEIEAKLAASVSARDEIEAKLGASVSARDGLQLKLETVEVERLSLADRLTKGDKLRGELLTEVLDLRKQARGAEFVHQPIDLVVGDLAAEIHKASTQLGETGSGFELASVNVKLHGVFDASGTSISLDDHDAIATSGSHVELQFQQMGADGSDPDAVIVPSVVGLTSVAARRLLQAHRLSMVTSTSTVSKTDAVRHGQAKLQSPAAGTSVVAGMPVHVVIASSADPLGA